MTIQHSPLPWGMEKPHPWLMGAFIKRAQAAWGICPKCGNSAKRGKNTIKMLLGERYHQALAEFQAQGLVPKETTNFEREEGRACSL